jgi:hypothetical protein
MEGKCMFHARDAKVIQSYSKDLKEWYNLRVTKGIINMDLNGIDFEGLDYIQLSQNGFKLLAFCNMIVHSDI